jgi:hypothetical protein
MERWCGPMAVAVSHAGPYNENRFHFKYARRGPMREAGPPADRGLHRFFTAAE